ncbi:patatin-like phospholipase family protein [Marinoscillum sp.]|uniref:patatin-like phospholipase family protein n=1 Tax=Marinoscillum sp. TaxID=2024838 RepID=UPI003BAA4579
MKPINILSIDGGGIRGIVPGTILVQCEQEFGIKVADYFDFIAGTSTGGILTCAYLCPSDDDLTKAKFTAEEVVGLYFDKGKQIFDDPFFHKLRSIWGVFGAKFPGKGIDSALQEYFGEVWLSQLLKPCLITSYDITNRNGHFFTQHDAKVKTDYDFLIKNVSRATSAAPTYFDCAHIENKDGETFTLVDGGVFVNNPAMCAYAEIRDGFKNSEGNPATAKDMKILSLGTGFSKKHYLYQKARKWGMAQWVRPVIDIMMSGSVEVDDFYLKRIFETTDHPNQYLRINSKMPGDVDPEMDNVTQANMTALKNLGEELFQANKEQLARWFEV